MADLSTQEVIDKYFKDERIIYPCISDIQKDTQGEFYLKYQKNNGVELWAGTDEGEIIICKTRDGERLERVILSLIN